MKLQAKIEKLKTKIQVGSSNGADYTKLAILEIEKEIQQLKLRKATLKAALIELAEGGIV